MIYPKVQVLVGDSDLHWRGYEQNPQDPFTDLSYSPLSSPNQVRALEPSTQSESSSTIRDLEVILAPLQIP
jgi:hypothetical protein